MQLTGNTILITGGGSGIGRGLAEAFHARGNQVIIAGRRREVLDTVTKANPGMHAETLDMNDEDALKSFAAALVQKYPKLNVVIHNAGIARMENVESDDFGDAQAMIATNLLGPMRLTAALLPTLKAQASAAILTVSSGLAFVPLVFAPTYSATKAALHSWTQSLRFQLRKTKIQVIEIIPPYVQTELGGAHQASDPRAMPLSEYIAETMDVLQAQPDAEENCVQRVYGQRFAEREHRYDDVFRQMNDAYAEMLGK